MALLSVDLVPDDQDANALPPGFVRAVLDDAAYTDSLPSDGLGVIPWHYGWAGRCVSPWATSLAAHSCSGAAKRYRSNGYQRGQPRPGRIALSLGPKTDLGR